MRRVRRSRSSVDGLQLMLRQGLGKFGLYVVTKKQQLVDDIIDGFLTEFPHLGLRTPRKSFYHYPVSGTPFTVIYEYDDSELRVLFIVHQSANRKRLKTTDVEW
jgi:hypothetical protein